MIIKFDQTPEEYFRLSRAAYNRGEYDRAFLYGVKALRGKGCVEYKVSCAEILLAMGRYADAASIALDALCHGRGFRAKLYDTLASAASGMGAFYDALHYVAKKAQYEGDDETLDAMDEVMQELEEEEYNISDEGPNLFLVGEHKSIRMQLEETNLVHTAEFAFARKEYDEAIALASRIESGSVAYIRARLCCLRAYLQKKDMEKALETAVELIGLDPKNGYVLYVLIVELKKKEYIPLLYDMKKGGRDLHYAAIAADHVGEHDVAVSLINVILKQKQYMAEAHFMAAMIYLNRGDRAKSEDILKRLFAMDHKFPQEVILSGWRKLKKCEIPPYFCIPNEVIDILEKYVKKQVKSSEEFAVEMLTDEAFRKSISILLCIGDRKLGLQMISYYDEVNNPQIDAFFTEMLLRSDVERILKRKLFVKLFLSKNKGSIYYTDFTVATRVPCAKPPRFEEFPYSVRRAYGEVLSVLAHTDLDCNARLQVLVERAAAMDGAEDISVGLLCMAFVYRMFLDGTISVMPWGSSLTNACGIFSHYMFHIKRVNMSKVRKIAAILAD